MITRDQALEKVKIGLESIYGDGYFSTGSDVERQDKKQFLKKTFENGWYIEIPIDEYLEDDTFIKRMFVRSGTTYTPLTENIYDQITSLHKELLLSHYERDGLDIVPDAKGNWHTSFIENIATIS